MATRHLVVYTPEPSSIENVYRFMKAAFYQRMKRYEFQLKLENTIDLLMNHRAELGIRKPADLLTWVRRKDPERGQRLSRIMEGLRFEMVMNQSRVNRDADVGYSVENVCNRYFGVPCEHLGHVDDDNAVWRSLRRRRHLILECPQSRLYTQLMGIARRMVTEKNQRAVVW